MASKLGLARRSNFNLAVYTSCFLKPSRPLKEGERFAATLVFEQAGTIDVEFAVQNMGARPEFANEHDGHGEAVQ